MNSNPAFSGSLLGLEYVAAATHGLRGVAVQTPLLESHEANERLGARLLIKAENMQRTGAFKIRGAYNCIRQLTNAQKAGGVITYSSGNHAQGVALAARLFGTHALIVMPDDVPEAKRAATRALGARIVMFSRDAEASDDVVERLRRQTGRIVVPPSGDLRVLAGAATVATELLEQASGKNARLDALLVPCGGGGLTAASAVVMAARSPDTRVYAVEPAQFDDTRRSLATGQRVANPPGRRTICDAIMTPMPNELTFAINRELLAGGLTASDAEVRDAMRFVYRHFRMVVEPGAAVGLAAVLAGQIDIAGKTVATIITGGNIDAARFCRLVGPDTHE